MCLIYGNTMTRITLEEKARLLARRKAELGIEGRSFVAVNSGKHRTESKRELLRTIERETKARGIQPRFRAAID
jgi:hypothetical protein